MFPVKKGARKVPGEVGPPWGCTGCGELSSFPGDGGIGRLSRRVGKEEDWGISNLSWGFRGHTREFLEGGQEACWKDLENNRESCEEP